VCMCSGQPKNERRQATAKTAAAAAAANSKKGEKSMRGRDARNEKEGGREGGEEGGSRHFVLQVESTLFKIGKEKREARKAQAVG